MGNISVDRYDIRPCELSRCRWVNTYICRPTKKTCSIQRNLEINLFFKKENWFDVEYVLRLNIALDLLLKMLIKFRFNLMNASICTNTISYDRIWLNTSNNSCLSSFINKICLQIFFRNSKIGDLWIMCK